MKVYIINLKRRPERLQKITTAFEEFGFKDYEVIEAIDGADQSYASVSNSYSSKRAKRLQRELTVGEICTALSHQKAYRKILDGDDSHGIVIEDDCPITQQLIDFCIGNAPTLDILLLGYYTSNENSPCPVYKDQSYQYAIMDICSDSRVYFTQNSIDDKYFEFDIRSRKVDFLHGGHCYCISKKGCEQIMKHNFPVMVEADNMWNYDLTIKMFGVRPMLVEINRGRDDSDLERERKFYQDTLQFDKRFLDRIHSYEFGR